MTTVTSCPLCAGFVWVRDELVAEPTACGLRIARSHARGPLRWTCARCGYMDAPEGLISVALDGASERPKEVAVR